MLPSAALYAASALAEACQPGGNHTTMIYSTHRLLPVLCCWAQPAGAESHEGLARSGRPAGVSNEHLHAESGHARLLRSGYASSEDAGPGYPSSPKEQRDSRGEDQQVRQTSPSESPESCT